TQLLDIGNRVVPRLAIRARADEVPYDDVVPGIRAVQPDGTSQTQEREALDPVAGRRDHDRVDAGLIAERARADDLHLDHGVAGGWRRVGRCARLAIAVND